MRRVFCQACRLEHCGSRVRVATGGGGGSIERLARLAGGLAAWRNSAGDEWSHWHSDVLFLPCMLLRIVACELASSVRTAISVAALLGVVLKGAALSRACRSPDRHYLR